MRKLLVTCVCKERIQVPRSALGRTGLCPSCGRSITITGDNATPLSPDLAGAQSTSVAAPGRGLEEAKLIFGQAVDHYFAGRCGQALVLFRQLNDIYPGIPEIEQAQFLCRRALRLAATSTALAAPAPTPALTHDSSEPDETELTPSTIKKFVLRKMVYGETEAIQLRAAELAGRMIGLLPQEPSDKPDVQAFRDLMGHAGNAAEPRMQQAGNF